MSATSEGNAKIVAEFRRTQGIRTIPVLALTRLR